MESIIQVCVLVPKQPSCTIRLVNTICMGMKRPRQNVQLRSEPLIIMYIRKKKKMEYLSLIDFKKPPNTSKMQCDAMRRCVCYSCHHHYAHRRHHPPRHHHSSLYPSKSSLRMPLLSHMPLNIPHSSHSLIGVSNSAILPCSITQIRS